jgi:isoleucyl-tRNA synthetase
MSFEKVSSSVDFSQLERDILSFWEREGIFDQLRKKNAGKPPWSFLDGPITANNPMGVHHAWGRTYKDVFNRYFAMTGRELRYQNGFDCQGLWVEVEVEKELGLKSKRDIENLVPGDRDASVAKFVNTCKARVDKFARIQSEQSIRLGMWMDWDKTDADWAKPVDERKSYFTMSNVNNDTIWSFLKKCADKKMIYRGYDAMPWCGRCGVGLSEMEVKEGYKDIEHRAVFVKFKLTDKPNEYLLAWTTTPWTLSSNVAAAVNPELTYVRVKLKDEFYYVAKGAFKFDRMSGGGGEEEGEPGASATGGKKSKRAWLDGVPHLKSIEQLFKEKAGKEKFEIVGEVKGADMLGWTYSAPFDDLEANGCDFGYPTEVARVAEARKWTPKVTACVSHKVIAWKEVGETEGTGIVHIAPGCGQADFELGKENGLPVVAPLDDSGCFHPGFGTFGGKNAAEASTADVVFEELKKREALFAIERYVHRYPHCWRCKSELLFRLVDEWFINMGPRNTEEGFRGQIMKVVNQVTFLPESLNGRAREYDWLWNMGDWMISKKRYWGLALPIWVDDETGEFEVIGSKAELKQRCVEGWGDFDEQSPHRPTVDNIKIRSKTTGNLMTRIPDVGNPWLDAGIVAFSTLKFNEDRDYWQKWYPADFITESFPGQFRNWFYALLALSTMMSDGQPPFKTLLGHGLVRDQFGHEMHKSTGNSIEFVAAADKGGIIKDPKGNELPFKAIGADVMRWLYCRQNPAQNLNFGPAPADEVRSKFIFKLWNSYAFFCNCAVGDGFDPKTHRVPLAERSDIDRWIVASLQVLLQTADTSFKKYDVMTFALAAERFVDDDLSNWYVRRVKPRLNSKVEGLSTEALKEKWSAYSTMYEVLTTLCQCLAPCVPFVTEVMWSNLSNATMSVHLTDFPQADASKIDTALITQMDTLRDVITLGGAARNVAKINVRQPLAEMLVRVATEDEVTTVQRFDQLIRDELNLKKVTASATTQLLKATAKFNAKTANAKLGAKRKEAEAELTARDARELAKLLRAGPVELAGVSLDAADVIIEYSAANEGYAGAADNKGREGVVFTVITEELKLEGTARNVIRTVNQARKDAGLEISDLIQLSLSSTNEALTKAITTHRTTIATETQATSIIDGELAAATYGTTSKIDDATLNVQLKKSS